MDELWYRYEEVRYSAPVDEWGECYGKGRLDVHIRGYKVLKHTAKGVWLDTYGIGKGRFVRLQGRKRYACPTKAEALVSFIARKQAQKRILESRLEDVHDALIKAKYLQVEEHTV